MGTRHLIAVQLDGQYKVAQYGQWDGYPSGQGLKVLQFIRGLSPEAYAAFVEKVRAAVFLTKEDVDAINARIAAGEFPDGWQHHFPHLSRDACAEILDIVAKAEPGIKLKNSIGFAGDSLFCEWAYVVDLDKRTLEAFKGFNKNELDAGERFGVPGLELDKTSDYFPVRIMKSWPLDALPADDEFVAALEPEDDED